MGADAARASLYTPEQMCLNYRDLPTWEAVLRPRARQEAVADDRRKPAEGEQPVLAAKGMFRSAFSFNQPGLRGEIWGSRAPSASLQISRSQIWREAADRGRAVAASMASADRQAACTPQEPEVLVSCCHGYWRHVKHIVVAECSDCSDGLMSSEEQLPIPAL